MLSFFKSNNPWIVAMTLLVLVLCRVVMMHPPQQYDYLWHHSEPATQLLLMWLPLSIYQLLLIAGAGLLYVEALLINYLINSYKLTTKKNYLGGLLFILLSSLLPDTMLLSPALIACLLLLVLLARLFELAKPDKLYTNIFDLGFLATLAALFYFPAVYFLLLAILGYLTIRSTALKGPLIILTGVGAMVVILLCTYFWYDRLAYVIKDVSNMRNNIPISSLSLSHWQLGVLIWLLALVGYSVLSIPRLLFSSVIQTRKYITIIVMSGLISIFASPLHLNFNLSHLLFLMISLSVLFTVYFVETKPSWLSEVIFYLVLVSIVVFQVGLGWG